MEVMKMRPSYYYTKRFDQEILDNHTLALPSDDDTWLYKSESSRLSGRYEDLQRCAAQLRDQQASAPSGPLDSRTFTRRKHPPLRPSLDSVVESPQSNNRSSLGILNTSQLLNGTLENSAIQTPIQENPGKIFSSFTVSDKKFPQQRVFRLDSPFVNSASLGRVGGVLPINSSMVERLRVDSESSELSIPLSLENIGSFDRNDAMTDSAILNLLDQTGLGCQPPAAFQDEGGMTSSLVSEGGMTCSLVSLPDNSQAHNALGFHEESEQMTDSMIHFLVPVNFKPPSGFEDCEMSNSVLNMDECDPLPHSEMTNSVMDYINNVMLNSPTRLTESTISSETENIPPRPNEKKDGLTANCTNKTKVSGDKRIEDLSQLNISYEPEKNGEIDLGNSIVEIANITYTNNINVIGRRKDGGDGEDDLNKTRTLNEPFEKELCVLKYNSERNTKTKALNNRDLNVTHDLNDEKGKDLNSTMVQSKESIPNVVNTTVLLSTKRNGTFTKSEISEALDSGRKIPSRGSPFNTTFTKLQSQAAKRLNSSFARSTDGLNGMEDDQSSSASDSSFSSCSTKPRSVDELRNIAQLQEDSLAQTSTPTDSFHSTKPPKLSLEFSPISSQSAGPGRDLSESRSANCSPVRDETKSRLSMHPNSPALRPLMQSRRLTLQASSLSNIARPDQVSRLRRPQPVSRLPFPRPATAPAPATGIPRPRAMVSRLPMPRSRGSGIPGPKRGGAY